MAQINRLTLQLTRHCNLNCSYCYCDPIVRGKVAGLPLQHLTRFVTGAIALGANHVVLTGGEPLLYPNISELVAFLVHNRLKIAVETNGLLLTKTLLDLFSGTKTHIAVTLESSTAATHDAIRGRRGSWQAAVDSLSLSSTYPNITSQITFNLTTRSQDEIHDICAMGARLGISRLKINPIYRIGPRGLTPSDDLYLEPKQLLDIARSSSSFLMGQYPFNLLLAIPPALLPLNVPHTASNCTGCSLSALLGVTYDGSIRPCHNFMYSGDHVFGKIDEEYDLAEISKRIGQLPGTNVFDIKGICSDCALLTQCKGFCRAQAHNDGGATDVSNALCQQLADDGLFPDDMRLSQMFGPTDTIQPEKVLLPLLA